MSLTIYQAAIEPALRMLGNLSMLLDKAEAHCAAKKIEPSALLGMRLYPDMFPLTRQVQTVSDTAKGLAARLAGVEVPSWADTETSFAELKARVAKTVDFLKSIPAAKFDGAESREIKLTLGGNPFTFPGLVFAFNQALPNFYFHVTTTYDILRHAGVEIGKRDYLGPR